MSVYWQDFEFEKLFEKGFLAYLKILDVSVSLTPLQW